MIHYLCYKHRGEEDTAKMRSILFHYGLSLNNAVVRTNFHGFAIDSTLMRLYLDNLFGADFNMKLQRYFELFFHINNSFGFL